MVKGIEIFKEYFKNYESQYVLIGGAACDILFDENESNFRVTRDIDMVLIVDALTPEFGERFWEFISDGEYRNKSTSRNNNQFYRFDKPVNIDFPKMIELFGKPYNGINENSQLTPIHIDDDISSLSAILLDEDYYQCLMDGKVVVDGLSVLRPEYLIVFKAKALLDLTERKSTGESIDSKNIKKHKNDILRLVAEMYLENIVSLPESVYEDMRSFTKMLDDEPFNVDIAEKYGQTPEAIKERLIKMLGMK